MPHNLWFHGGPFINGTREHVLVLTPRGFKIHVVLVLTPLVLRYMWCWF